MKEHSSTLPKANAAGRWAGLAGPLAAFLSAFLFSFGGLVMKGIPWQPLTINGVRNAVALVITLTYLRATRHRLVFNRSVLLGAASMMLTTVLFCAANKMTTAANAILLQFTSPVFLILILWIFRGQRPKKRDAVMCLCVFAGILCFFVGGLTGGHLAGDGLALLSGVFYAVVFLSEDLPGGDAASAFFWGEVLSAAVGLPFLLGETVFTFPALGGALGLGFIIGVGYILLSLSLKTTPPVTATLMSAVEPVLNPTWVALLNGETMSPPSFAGFVVVLGSIVVYNLLLARKK